MAADEYDPGGGPGPGRGEDMHDNDPASVDSFESSDGWRLYDMKELPPLPFEDFVFKTFKSCTVFSLHQTTVGNKFSPSLSLRFSDVNDWRTAQKIKYTYQKREIVLAALQNSQKETRVLPRIVKNMFIKNCPYNLATNPRWLMNEISQYVTPSGKPFMVERDNRWNGVVCVPVKEYKLIPNIYTKINCYDRNGTVIPDCKDQVQIFCKGIPTDNSIPRAEKPAKHCVICGSKDHFRSKCPSKDDPNKPGPWNMCKTCRNPKVKYGCTPTSCSKQADVDKGIFDIEKPIRESSSRLSTASKGTKRQRNSSPPKVTIDSSDDESDSSTSTIIEKERSFVERPSISTIKSVAGSVMATRDSKNKGIANMHLRQQEKFLNEVLSADLSEQDKTKIRVLNNYIKTEMQTNDKLVHFAKAYGFHAAAVVPNIQGFIPCPTGLGIAMNNEGDHLGRIMEAELDTSLQATTLSLGNAGLKRFFSTRRVSLFKGFTVKNATHEFYTNPTHGASKASKGRSK